MSKKFALIGHPLGHTLSPVLHNEIFRMKGLPYSYEAKEVMPHDLNKEILSVYDGLNVTIPYKEQVIPFLDFLSDKAEILGSVNTIKNDGTLTGFNTDAPGFLKSLEQNDISINNKNVLILGCGGVARAIAITCASLNCTLTLCARDIKKADALAEEINLKGYEKPSTCTFENITSYFDLMVQCTPVGMYPNINNCVVNDEVIKNCDAIFDTIYNPVKTLLIKKAEGFGKKAVSGLEMLVFQAILAEEIWLETTFTEYEITHLINFTGEKLKELYI